MNTGMRLNVTTVIKVSMIKKLKKREKISQLLLRTEKSSGGTGRGTEDLCLS